MVQVYRPGESHASINRMLKKSASVVLGSSKSSTYPRGYASGFDSPTALPNGLFEHPVWCILVIPDVQTSEIPAYPQIFSASAMRRTLIDPSKQRCDTMRDDETLVFPAAHVHRPVERCKRGSRAAHGRFIRHDRTVLQFRHGKGRGFAELSRPLPLRLPRSQCPWNRQTLDDHLQGRKYFLQIRRKGHRLENPHRWLLHPL